MKYIFFLIIIVFPLLTNAQVELDSNWVKHWERKQSCVIYELNFNNSFGLVLDGKLLSQNHQYFLNIMCKYTGFQIDTNSFYKMTDTSCIIDFENKFPKYLCSLVDTEFFIEDYWFKQYIPFHNDSIDYLFITLEKFDVNQTNNKSVTIDTNLFGIEFERYKLIYSRILNSFSIDYDHRFYDHLYLLYNITDTSIILLSK